MENLKCTKCGEVKSVADFHKNKRSKTGYKSACKQCCSADGMLYRKRRAEARNAEREAMNAFRGIIEGVTKACSQCDVVKPLDEYFNYAGTKDGKDSSCKVCTTARNRRWYERNRERVAEMGRKKYERNFPEAIARGEAKRKRKKELEELGLKECPRCKEVKDPTLFYVNTHNRGGRSSHCKACIGLAQKANRAAANARNSAYKKRYPEKNRQWGELRRARKFQATVPGYATPNLEYLIKFYGKACIYPGCDKEITDRNPASLDHIQPISKGGKDTYANAQPLCRIHNAGKGNFHDTDYRLQATAGGNKEGIIITNITRIKEVIT